MLKKIEWILIIRRQNSFFRNEQAGSRQIILILLRCIRIISQKEVEKLLLLLSLQKNVRALDIGCGIARWVGSSPENIWEYCGVDFSEELIHIAKNRKEDFSPMN